MKKILLYSMLIAASAAIFTGCKDDNEDFGGSDADRLFMPMFRLTQNLNSTTTDYHCDIASRVDPQIETYLNQHGYKTSTHVNDMRLFWYGVEGADAYELKAKVQGTSWDKAENPNLLDTILTADQLSFLHEDLQYGTGYLYAIRALVDRNDLNNPRNSKWYGYGDGSHQQDQSRDDSREQTGALTTGMRYDVPSLFWVENVTKTSMDVCFLPETEDGWENSYKEFIEAGAEVKDGKWVFDEIRVVPSADNAQLEEHVYKLTDADKAAGRVHFDNLVANAAYIVSGQNNNVTRYYDRQYNSNMVRMQGDPGEPIHLPAATAESVLLDTLLQNGDQYNMYGVKDLIATRIDTVLTNYMSDNTLAEGQVFYLEGGKTYYLSSSVDMTKGFTLATNPEDIAAGKGRATVLQGIGWSNEAHTAANVNNWNLCRRAQSGTENGVTLAIQAIVFEDINFHPMAWFNYMDQKGTDGNSQYTICGNYFMNMNSQGLSFILSELRVSNCTFCGHVRGFIRFQGPNRQIIEKLTVDNCVFYDEGGYDTKGRGYAWFAGPGSNRKSNFYKNFTFSNNTIIDCPRVALVQESASKFTWPEGTTWNINLSNNTFVNFSTRSSGSGDGRIFNFNIVPVGSNIAFKKNLFVWAGNKNDVDRSYYMKGMYASTKDLKYDFADNYSTVMPSYKGSKSTYLPSTDPKTTLIDGMFSAVSFSNKTSGAGYKDLNIGGYGETQIKFGDNHNGNEDDAVGYQLTAEELFKDPYTIGMVTAAETFEKDAYRHKDISGFYYNNTPRVTAHPIYTKEIGDPRWRTGASWDGGKNHVVKSGDITF